MERSLVIALAVLALGLSCVALSRRPDLLRDFRRSFALAVSIVSLLVVILGVYLLVVGLELRDAAFALGQEDLVPKWNGLVLGAVFLLLIGSLAFLFTLGILVWSAARAPAPTWHPRRDAF